MVGLDLERTGQLAAFPGSENIKSLSAGTAEIDMVPSLDRFQKLEAVDLCFAMGRDARLLLRALVRCRSMKGINLYESGVKDEDLAVLAEMQQLIQLELSGNREVTDHGLASLESMSTLRVLGLYGTSVTPAGVARLRAVLPECDVYHESVGQ